MKKEYKAKIKSGEKFSVSGLDYGPNRKTFKGCNGKAEYNPATKVATSYNWWKFTLPIGRVVILNTYRYSVTTSGHQSDVKNLLIELGETVLRLNVGRGSLTATKFKERALIDLYERLAQNHIVLNRKGTRPDMIKDRKQDNMRLFALIKRVKKLGAVITSQMIETINKDAEETEQARLKKAREDRESRKALVSQMRQVEKQGEMFTLN